MPIVDIEVVCAPGEAATLPAAPQLASVAGKVFGSTPGRTWVRLRALDAARYGENDVAAPVPGPVFVRVMHARPPVDTTLEAEIAALTAAIGAALGRPAEHVHVEYAPPAVGRMAFGGQLVR